MTFSKQDAVTFLVGLVVSALFVVGEALVQSEAIAENPTQALFTFLTGLGTATGRYIITFLTQRGFTEPPS